MNYKDYSDSELCSMICESNEDAKDILFEKYKYIIDIIIKKYKLSSLKVNIEYGDLYQEALVGFSDALNSYDENKEANLKTFISLCIERRLQNIIIKAKTNKNKIFLEALSLDYQKNENSCTLKEVISDESINDPLYNISKEEEYYEILKQIKEVLSSNEYEVFTLMISGLNYIEIANNLEKTPKQIDNSIQRIKNKVKKIIENNKK